MQGCSLFEAADIGQLQVSTNEENVKDSNYLVVRSDTERALLASAKTIAWVSKEFRTPDQGQIRKENIVKKFLREHGKEAVVVIAIIVVVLVIRYG